MHDKIEKKLLKDLHTDRARWTRLGGAAIAGFATIGLVSRGIETFCNVIKHQSIQENIVGAAKTAAVIAIGAYVAARVARKMDERALENEPTSDFTISSDQLIVETNETN